MKRNPFIESISAALFVSVLAGIVLFAPGCASTDVNPATPRAHTGYVDIYADGPDPLLWNVEQVDDAGNAKQFFRQEKLIDEGFARLAFEPGHYTLRISVLNRAVTEPATVAVDVKDGMITPVHVTLTSTGKALIESKDARVTGTYYGRYGRSTKLRDYDASTYRASAEPQPAISYSPKGQMPYRSVQPATKYKAP